VSGKTGVTLMRVRARAGSRRDCAENSVAAAFFFGAPDADCAKPAEGAARPSMAAPVATTTTVIVRVIFFFKPLIWPTLAHCGAAVNVCAVDWPEGQARRARLGRLPALA